MAVRIIRKKRLFEDDTTTNQQVTQNNNTQQPVQNNPQPVQNNANQQPVNTQQPQPTDQNAQQQQNNQQNNQQQQDTQQLNDNQKAVQELLELMKNTYWCISNNIPEMIKEKIPTFTPDNVEAKPIIDLWDAFKKEPNETTFNSFVDAFTKFGSQQQQPDVNNTQQNVNASTIYNFRNALHENLSKAMHKQMTEKALKNYFG